MTTKKSPYPTAAHPRAPDRQTTLDALRAAIARIEGASLDDGRAAFALLGVAAIDGALPGGALPGGGLARGALHEITGSGGADPGAAATGVALWFASRLCAPLGPDRAPRPWLWCARGTPPYGPGLHDFGLAPERLVLVRCADDREALWAAEEGLASAALGVVVVEAATPGAAAVRRLALAARESGTAALLLRAQGPASGAIAAATRWRAAPAPGNAWDVALMRARGAWPQRWRIAWQPGAGPCLIGSDGNHDAEQDRKRGAAAPGAVPVARALRGGADPRRASPRRAGLG